MPTVEFHFDFGSPNAYLAHRAIPVIEQRTGVKFDYVPILLGGVFKATNNVSPAISLQGIRNKPEYMGVETERFLKRYGVENYQMNPHFPVNTLRLMRGAVYLKGSDGFEPYVEEVFRHMWVAPRKMDDPEVVAEAFGESGLPVAELLGAMEDPDVKAALVAATEASVARGTFGAPTFFLDGEIYFGKNTLPEIEEVLAG